MRDLLFLCHRLPYPPDKGDKIRCWNIFRHLSDRFRVYFGCFVDDPADHRHESTIRDRCAEAIFVRLRRPIATARCAQGLLSGKPLTLGYYGNSTLSAWVEGVIARRGLNRAFVFSSAMAQYLMGDAFRTIHRVADLVDVDSEKWRQYAQTKPWPMGRIYQREGRRLLDFERQIAAQFSDVILVSRRETDLFSRLVPAPRARVSTVTNGVDGDYFSPHRSYKNPYRPDATPIVFVGAMDYWPNIDAACWFANEILPVLTTDGVDYHFFIVGSNPSRTVRNLAQLSGVTVTGRVPDVRPYLAHAAIAVAPLRIARGVQNKVLEAMAMARPVVTTTEGAEGVDAHPGRHLLVADDPAAFASAVRRALSDNAGAIMGERARELIMARHGWRTSVESIVEIVDDFAEEAAARSSVDPLRLVKPTATAGIRRGDIVA
jgi:sugar transferase (PEP-CTERM/EpsH1 system associated)